MAVGIDWEGFPFCFLNDGRKVRQSIGIVGSAAGPGSSEPRLSPVLVVGMSPAAHCSG